MGLDSGNLLNYVLFIFVLRLFLGAFANLRNAFISFVISVSVRISLSVRMEQIGSHQTDFNEILYLRIFRKSVKYIQVLLKSDNNKGHFT